MTNGGRTCNGALGGCGTGELWKEVGGRGGSVNNSGTKPIVVVRAVADTRD